MARGPPAAVYKRGKDHGEDKHLARGPPAAVYKRGKDHEEDKHQHKGKKVKNTKEHSIERDVEGEDLARRKHHGKKGGDKDGQTGKKEKKIKHRSLV